MSKITVVASSFTTERVTQTMIINRFLRETESGGYGTVTAAGATTSEFYDTTALKSGQYTSDDLEKCWVRINYSTDGLAPQGDIRPITEFDPELGRVKVAPAFSAALGAGDTYQFFRWPHPQKLIDHIDSILTEETMLPTMGICTEIPDGDMEASTTTEWDTSASAIQKKTESPLGGGRRYLEVVDSGSGGGYALNNGEIYVEPGEAFHLSALGRSPTAVSQSLVAYDATNSVEIAARTFTRQQWVRPWIDLTIPAACNELQIRLRSDSANGTTYWDDVCLYPLGETSIALPRYIESPDQVKKMFRLIPSEIKSATNIWSSELHLTGENGWDVYEDSFRGINRLRTRLTHTNQPLVFYGIRKEEAFTAPNTDYKAISSNWMHAELCVKVFESLSSWPGAGALDSKWIDRKLKDYVQMRQIERYKAAMRLDKVFQAPSPMVYAG